MAKKIVAGNWKMNLNLSEGSKLVEDILEGMPALSAETEVIIAPPCLHLTSIASLLADQQQVKVSAQNCHTDIKGAFTGEVSAAMLIQSGIGTTLIGHSERREYCNETDEILARKVNAALAAGMQIIFCCGEALEIRKNGTQNDWVHAQLQSGLFHLGAEAMKQVSIAYEPIWAIGTGETATTEQAQDMHSFIRRTLIDKYGQAVADNISLLYGGSCKPDNAAELFACKDVDGGLIGGASLKAEDFLKIIAASNAA